MFGRKKLERRVKRLEEKFDKLQQEKDCKEGRHVYELCIHTAVDIPHARCKHCYFHPSDTKSKGSTS